MTHRDRHVVSHRTPARPAANPPPPPKSGDGPSACAGTRNLDANFLPGHRHAPGPRRRHSGRTWTWLRASAGLHSAAPDVLDRRTRGARAGLALGCAPIGRSEPRSGSRQRPGQDRGSAPGITATGGRGCNAPRGTANRTCSTCRRQPYPRGHTRRTQAGHFLRRYRTHDLALRHWLFRPRPDRRRLVRTATGLSALSDRPHSLHRRNRRALPATPRCDAQGMAETQGIQPSSGI